MSNSDTTPSITDGLEDLLRGAGTFGVGEIVEQLAGFLLHWLLTTTLGATLYGVYVYAHLFLSVAQMFGDIGARRAIVRFLPEYEGDKHKQGGYLGFAMLTAFLGSCLFVVILWFVAPVANRFTLNKPILTSITRVLAISLPFLLLVRLLSSSFRGVGRIDRQIKLNRIVYPVAKVAAVAVIAVAGATLFRASIGILIATILSAGIGLVMLFRSTGLHPSLSIPREDAREFLNFSVPISISNVEGLLYSTVDVFMIGWLLTSADVGIYKIALLLGTLLVLPLQAMNQMFAPLASNLYNEGDFEALASINKVTTRWVFSVVVLMAAGLYVYRRPILSLFGPDFVRGHQVLVIILFGYFLNTAVGPVNWLLTMTDRQYYVMANSWVSVVLNLGLNFVLIQEFGMTGAAIATASTLSLVNVLRLVEVWKLEGIHPYSFSFTKPIGAGLISFGVMIAVHRALPGLTGLFVGGIIGTIVYVACLWLLGIEDQDVHLANKVLKRAGTE